MAAETRPAAANLAAGGLDPFKFVWQLLTNVKFALVLVGTAASACLLGVVLPQLPGPMRTNAAARSAWMQLRDAQFGVFAGPMDRLQLFDIFHSVWFNALWLVLIVAVTVCTVSRFMPTVRSVQKPTKVVGDGYFTRAHHSANFTHDGGADAVEAILKHRRYHVERTKVSDDGTVYLFAERFSWSQYGTFLSHLALLMLLVGALLTVVAGFDRTFVLAEGTPPFAVFDQAGPNQIFVKMVEAVRGKDANGNIVDFHSIVQVRRGDQTITCSASVNTPCRAFGYKIHQAAFFDDVARLHVTAPDGQVVWDDVVDFDSQSVAVPVIKVTDSHGNVLFNQDLPQMGTDTGGATFDPGSTAGDGGAAPLAAVPNAPADDTTLTSAEASSGTLIGTTSRPVATAVLVFPKAPGVATTVSDPTTAAANLASEGVSVARGQRQAARVRSRVQRFRRDSSGQANRSQDGDYRIEYSAATSIPAVKVDNMPGSISDDGSATFQMPIDSSKQPYLYVAGIDLGNVALTQGNTVSPQNGYHYTFQGQVNAGGISVKRDPGSTFIWIAVGMAIVGLAITFYVPRRRLWVKVGEGRTFMAGRRRTDHPPQPRTAQARRRAGLARCPPARRPRKRTLTQRRKTKDERLREPVLEPAPAPGIRHSLSLFSSLTRGRRRHTAAIMATSSGGGLSVLQRRFVIW